MREQIPYVDDNYEYFDQQLSISSSDDFSKLVDDSAFSNMKKTMLISFQRKETDSITLREWLDKYHLPEELQAFFVNMDVAMKYIHEQGYYIESFALDSIEVLNDSIKQIRFDYLQEMPPDFIKQKELVKNNIFLSAVLQIGVYANCLQYFRTETMQFLKENFEQFYANTLSNKVTRFISKESPKSGYICCGNAEEYLKKDNVYYVGECAGIASDQNGEGIYQAVLSGIKAATDICNNS